MSLKNTCFFNNFGATNFNLIPSDFNIDGELLSNNFEKINECIDNDIDNIVVIGSYETQRLICDNIINIDFPNNEDKENNYHILLDSWAFTINDIVEEYINSGNLFVLTSEYLSLLEDPRPLLLSIKKLFLNSEKKQKLILIHYENCLGYRTWNKKSLQNFLTSSGFEYVIKSERDEVFIFDVNITENGYQTYLQNHKISKELINSTMLLLTTEDASISPTGGIGTYVKNMKNLNPDIAVLFCDTEQISHDKIDNTIFVKDFIEFMDYDNFMNGLGLIEIVKSILYTLPNLSLIEFQDYQALGFRMVQAKKTGVLPQYLWLRAFLHGNVDSLKYGTQNHESMNYNYYELLLSVKDNYVFKYVNETFMPSNYLKNLMENEYDIKLNSPLVQRLPFDLSLIKDVSKTKIEKINKIVYIGKYNELKGWFDFVESIQILNKQNRLKNIKKIISLSPGTPATKEIKILSSIGSYESLHLSHEEFMKFIEENKNDTLFIVPSKGDNFSFVALELLLSGALYVSYKAGGVVEVVDNDEYLDRYFCEVGSENLSEKIYEVLISDLSDTSKFLTKNQKLVYHRQENVNMNLSKLSKKKYIDNSKVSLDIKNISKEINIVVPVYNTKLEYIKDLLVSICSLRIKPAQILFVNDGSKDEYILEFKTLLKKFLFDIDYKIISQPNTGLAGARNRGLLESKSKYTYFIDSDDAFIPSSLYTAWVGMQISPSLVAINGFAGYFTDFNLIKSSLELQLNGLFWKPIGHSSAKALSLYENQYITASVFIHTDTIKSIGGWDQSDKATWEDWAFYTKLAWSGYEFSLVPVLGYLYRDAPNSMSKTYNNFFGRRRIIRNLITFSKMDANIIISLMSNSENSSLDISPIEHKMLLAKRKMLQNEKLKKVLKKVYLFSQKIKAKLI